MGLIELHSFFNCREVKEKSLAVCASVYVYASMCVLYRSWLHAPVPRGITYCATGSVTFSGLHVYYPRSLFLS